MWESTPQPPPYRGSLGLLIPKSWGKLLNLTQLGLCSPWDPAGDLYTNPVSLGIHCRDPYGGAGHFLMELLSTGSTRSQLPREAPGSHGGGSAPLPTLLGASWARWGPPDPLTRSLCGPTATTGSASCARTRCPPARTSPPPAPRRSSPPPSAPRTSGWVFLEREPRDPTPGKGSKGIPLTSFPPPTRRSASTSCCSCSATSPGGPSTASPAPW